MRGSSRTSRSGRGDSLAVVYLPNEAARYTILYSHGNAEDLGHVRPLLQALRDLGFAEIGYDYRGYGQSGGGPASARTASEDAEAVHRYATGHLGIASEDLTIYGTSVGSGPAVELRVGGRGVAQRGEPIAVAGLQKERDRLDHAIVGQVRLGQRTGARGLELALHQVAARQRIGNARLPRHR